MRKAIWLLILGLGTLATSCNRADEDLEEITTPGAANMAVIEVSSRIETFTADGSCFTSPFPVPTIFSAQVVTIRSNVEWFQSATCEGGITPRVCAADNLTAGAACIVNTDCDLTNPNDKIGRCQGPPCTFDSECLASGDPMLPDDTCGSPSARLVFAEALSSGQTLDKGVLLFDTGAKDLILNNSLGAPFPNPVSPGTPILVRSGDITARDLIYSREFVINTSTSFDPTACFAEEFDLSSLKLSTVGIPLLFRIDAVDAVTSVARLSTVNAVNPIITEATCCKVDLVAFGLVGNKEVCSDLLPDCGQEVICGDGIDNDADGAIDCSDFDCVNRSPCV